MGTSGVFGNFPSPDDLMNLAPYLANELNGQKAPALIGQSVLPLAYVFVRKGATNITTDDILDIRPFFRTAELAYNERAGLAAANPPTSLANPVVTDSDLSNRLSHMGDIIPKVDTTSTFPVERTVFLPIPINVWESFHYTENLKNKTWTIEGIPDEDKSKIVSMQFHIFGQLKDGDDIDSQHTLYMSGGSEPGLMMEKHSVGHVRNDVGKGEVDAWTGANQTFNHPVSYFEDQYGVKTLQIWTDATVSSGHNKEFGWWMSIWGYTVRDDITPVSVTYPY